MRLQDLAFVVGEHRGEGPVQDAGPSRAQRRSVATAVDPLSPASTPISSTSESSRNAVKVPIAFEPPPTQATTRFGTQPSAASACSRASSPITR